MNHIRVPAGAAMLALFAGCAAPPRYVPPAPTTYPMQQTAAQPVEPEVHVEPESSGFSLDSDTETAQVAISNAEATYRSVQAQAKQFLARKPVNCRATELEVAIDSLRSVDAQAQQYLGIATLAPEASDREAAMDVLDELNTVVLDGLLDITKTYRTGGCLPRAKQLVTDIKRVYSGPAYEGWGRALDEEAAAIQLAKAKGPSPVKPEVKAKVIRTVKGRQQAKDALKQTGN